MGSEVISCPVRGCGLALRSAERVMACAAGHSFDRAREGYVNLLQPGDRRSLAAGDGRAAVEARWRLEERGVGAQLRGRLAEFAAEEAGEGALLDAGAGTGALLEALVARRAAPGVALELSALAAARGARQRPALTWIVANADRRLPLADGSAGLLLSSLGPKNPAEFERVLAPGGRLVLAVPAPEDLVELRAAVQGEGRLESRALHARARFRERFEVRAETRLRERARLAPADLADLLAVGYRGARRTERERLVALAERPGFEVTLAVDALRLARR